MADAHPGPALAPTDCHAEPSPLGPYKSCVGGDCSTHKYRTDDVGLHFCLACGGVCVQPCPVCELWYGCVCE